MSSLISSHMCKEHGYTHERTSGQKPPLDHHRVPARAPPRHRLRRVHRLHRIQQRHEGTRKHHETGAWKPLETACRIFPNGWRTYFTKNFEDVEMPAAANISHDSDPERPIKVDSKCGCCLHRLFTTCRSHQHGHSLLT